MMKNIFISISTMLLLPCALELGNQVVVRLAEVTDIALKKESPLPSQPGLKVVRLEKPNCGRKNDDLAETNVKYFRIIGMDEKLIDKERFYREILMTAKFLNFAEGTFNDNNFKFSVSSARIGKYGKSYIAKYSFLNAPNASQSGTTIILNVLKKEISIWDFKNVEVSNGTLGCSFSVRGKITSHKLIYSSKCESFIKAI